MEQDQKHYYAFISHSSKDEKIAKWLCKQLEWYHIPTAIQKEYHAPKRLKPIFLYEIDLSKNVLKRALESELFDSQYLIVICSPAAAKSSHVNEEVLHFIHSGRYDKIIPFIIDGTPFASLKGSAEEECFPPALVALKGTEQELRGIDIREEKKHRGSKKAAVIDVIASMLGVRMDVLWDRYKKRLKKLCCVSLFFVLLLLCFIYLFVVPTTITITLQGDKHNLPEPQEAELFINNFNYQLSELDTTIGNIILPGVTKSKYLYIKFQGKYYIPIQEKIFLNFKAYSHYTYQLHRDSTFQIYAGHILDQEGKPLEDANVYIENHNIVSNKEGFFKIEFPIEQQTVSKKIKISKHDYEVIEREEVPSKNATFILFKK